MSLNSFFLRKILQSKLRGVPEGDQEKILAMLEKNPTLFQQIGLEAQEKIKSGEDQMTAMMSVIKKYEDQIKNLM